MVILKGSSMYMFFHVLENYHWPVSLSDPFLEWKGKDKHGFLDFLKCDLLTECILFPSCFFFYLFFPVTN